MLQGLKDYQAKYAVDHVHYVEDIPQVLAKLNPVSLHVLSGTNTDRCGHRKRNIESHLLTCQSLAILYSSCVGLLLESLSMLMQNVDVC